MIPKCNRDLVNWTIEQPDFSSKSRCAFRHFNLYKQLMGQQHRVQAKRKRPKAYLKRKQETRRAARPTPKPKTKKQTAQTE